MHETAKLGRACSAMEVLGTEGGLRVDGRNKFCGDYTEHNNIA